MIRDFNSAVNNQNQCFPNLFLTNLRSISNKIDELRCQILILNPDVVVCTETWLSSRIPTQAVDIPGYMCFRTDRKNDSGRGGVGVWIKSRLRAKKLLLAPLNQAEACWVHLPSNNLIVLGLYLPPNMNVPDFNFISDQIVHAADNL